MKKPRTDRRIAPSITVVPDVTRVSGGKDLRDNLTNVDKIRSFENRPT